MKTADYDLTTSTMLVEFNASVWTARALDKKVTDEVNHDKQASKQAGRFNKNLMAGRTELAEIQAIVGAARTFIYQWSAPWADSGSRWLPTQRLLKIDQRLCDYKAEFDEKVEAFLQIYPTLIVAQAMALGDMFDRNEYPSVEGIRRRFAFTYTFIPVPSTKDFRIAIAADAQEDLRKRLEEALDARVAGAVADMRDRLVDHLKRLSDRLVTDVDPKTGDPKNRKFHDTLVSGAFDLCDLLGELNVGGDPTLAAARTRLETALTGTTAEVLRTDSGKREDVKKEVDAILNSWDF
jgi:hypothetical protein